MNPQGVRKAIADGLKARGAWTNYDVFEYPGGDRVTRKGVLELGKIQPGSIEASTLGDGGLLWDYTIEGQIVLPGTGAADARFAETEAAMVVLLTDIETWLLSVNQGKGLGVGSLDILHLASFNLNPTADGGCVSEIAFEVSETS